MYEAHRYKRRTTHSMASKMIGQRVGQYTIVEHIYSDEVKARCATCKSVVERRLRRLKDPCNCPINLTGRYFGMLRVLRLSGRKAAAHDEWVCLCACGRETFSPARGLVSGGKVSCGCAKGYLTALGSKITRAKQQFQRRLGAP